MKELPLSDTAVDGKPNLDTYCMNALAISSAEAGWVEKFRMTNLEWGVYFFSVTNLVRTF